MNKLVPIEFKNQRIMTTKVLAEQYGTDEGNIQKNFSNNGKRFTEGKHYYKLEGQTLKEFKNSLPKEIREPIKFAPVLYLWTDRGAARHAKILDTDEAWNVYEELEDSYFNPKSINILGNMSKELQAIFVLDGKQQQLDSRLSNLENRMTIETGRQKILCDLVKKKVISVLGGKDTQAYKELSKKAFSSCWRDFKNALNVASYKDTAVKDFDIAKKAIIDWKPNRELELMIIGCNAQIRM